MCQPPAAAGRLDHAVASMSLAINRRRYDGAAVDTVTGPRPGRWPDEVDRRACRRSEAVDDCRLPVGRGRWDPKQAARFIAAVAEDRKFALWSLLLDSGMRRGEVCALRWTHVDLETGQVTVAANRVQAGPGLVVEGTTKSDRVRTFTVLVAGGRFYQRSTKRPLTMVRPAAPADERPGQAGK
jgi:integrase